MAEKKFDEYVMVAPGSDYGLNMWADLKKMQNCTFYDYVLSTNSKLLKILHHIHFSFALNKRFDVPLQSVWNSVFSLNSLELEPNNQYCIIFTDISACRVGKSYLKKLSELKNVTLVLVLVNVLETKKNIILGRINYFNYSFSFDRSDCSKYGFIYHPTFYSKTRENNNVEVETDAFFVGVSKGMRYQKLLKLQQTMDKEGLRTDFYLSHVKNSYKPSSRIHLNKWLSYSEVLDKVMKTRCLIEIMGGNQEGLTLRAMEAICYNKLLLTDNPSVKSLPYYETGFIQYAEDIEKADLAFMNRNIVVDYRYKGDFSPLHLITHINDVAFNR